VVTLPPDFSGLFFSEIVSFKIVLCKRIFKICK
jgi:hypothetical protein